MIFCTQWVLPSVIEIWEAILTILFFPVLVGYVFLVGRKVKSPLTAMP